MKRSLQDYKPQISPILWKNYIRADDFLDLVREGCLYGFAIVDIIATEDANKFLEINWPPILKKDTINFDDLPDWMQLNADKKTFPRETIVQSMCGQEILLHTSLIEFYLNNGFEIVKIYSFFEYEGKECFKKVYETVYNARVEATKLKDNQKAMANKLCANAMYGQMLLNPLKFTKSRVTTLKGFKTSRKKMSFKNGRQLSDNLFEVTSVSNNAKEKYPIVCGHTVLHLSKLILMKFVLFLHDFLKPNCFELIYTGMNLIIGHFKKFFKTLIQWRYA